MSVSQLLTVFLLTVSLIATSRGQVQSQSILDNRVLKTSASCDNQYIYFRINFEQPFQGLIYTENAFPSCIYVNGTSRPSLSYDVRVPLAGCLTKRTTAANYENAVIVQESPIYLESTDRKYLLTCVPDTDSNKDSSFTLNFGGVAVESELKGTEVVQGTGGTESLNYTVSVVRGIGPGGPALAGAIDVGDDISYVVRIEDLKNNDVRIGKCWANDEVSTIQLSDDNGCSQQRTGNVWGNFQVINSQKTRVYYNHIKAWAFPTSQRVNIFCNLHVCRSQCPVTNCLGFNGDNALQRLQRRGLTTAVDDAAMATINAAFDVMTSLQSTSLVSSRESAPAYRVPAQVITDPDVPYKYQAQTRVESTNDDEVCINKIVFSIGLSLFILITLLAILFVTLYCYRHGSTLIGYYSKSSNQSVTSDASFDQSGCRRAHAMDSDRSTGSIITRASSQIFGQRT